jgi:hypothetical protein
VNERHAGTGELGRVRQLWKARLTHGEVSKVRERVLSDLRPALRPLRRALD